MDCSKRTKNPDELKDKSKHTGKDASEICPVLVNQLFNQLISGLFINVILRSLKACLELQICESEQDTQTCY